VHGEIWQAESVGEAITDVGSEIEVVAVEGLKLRVRPGERRG
jgi:membrane protein implicated in regulation of membrane protease activity